MGKPRLIILIRHAQSEGNKNRAIHQMVPDHRVKLTDEGWKQAEDAGQRLRHLLRPDDSLQIFTSPYRRARETTEGILRTLTSHSTSDSPSPFSRHRIKVYEEPRLREQDFGNFQPDSTAMERMWQERADYGHFFYRIPNGESAADAYDRVSGFNESLWRQFGEKDFPSVLVLVSHGLMCRVFLMKWYHWSVEYFEDLRNVNHCEFIIMKKNQESGKYALENNLRTWSELKRQRQEQEAAKNNPSRRNTLSAFLKEPEEPPSVPTHQWAEHNTNVPLLEQQLQQSQTPSSAADVTAYAHKSTDETDDHPLGSEAAPSNASTDGAADNSNTTFTNPFPPKSALPIRPLPPHLASEAKLPRPGPSGTSTPHEMPSDEENEYFPAANNTQTTGSHKSGAPKTGHDILAASLRQAPERKPTPEDIERWVGESGMGTGKHADALGDEPDPEAEEGKVDRELREQRRREEGVKGSVY